MRRFCYPAAAFLLIAPLATTWAQSPHPAKIGGAVDEGAARLLRRMVEAERTTPYIAREETFRADAPGASHIVKSDPSRGIRREPVDGKAPAFIVGFYESGNGKSSRLPEPARKRVEELFKRFVKGILTAQVVGQDTVVGRACDIVQVQATGIPGAPSRRFWIDRATGLRLRTEEKSAAGKLLSGSYYTSLDLKPTFAANDFIPTPSDKTMKGVPKRLNEFGDRRRFKSLDDAKKAGVAVSMPGYVPTGFTLRSVESTANGNNIALRYTNGVNVLSLATLKGGVPPRMRRFLRPDGSAFVPLPQGKNGLFTRGTNGVAYLLISDLPENELRKIAASLK